MKPILRYNFPFFRETGKQLLLRLVIETTKKKNGTPITTCHVFENQSVKRSWLIDIGFRFNMVI